VPKAQYVHHVIFIDERAVQILAVAEHRATRANHVSKQFTVGLEGLSVMGRANNHKYYYPTPPPPSISLTAGSLTSCALNGNLAARDETQLLTSKHRQSPRDQHTVCLHLSLPALWQTSLLVAATHPSTNVCATNTMLKTLS
jgi:hypothetical protein